MAAADVPSDLKAQLKSHVTEVSTDKLIGLAKRIVNLHASKKPPRRLVNKRKNLMTEIRKLTLSDRATLQTMVASFVIYRQNELSFEQYGFDADRQERFEMIDQLDMLLFVQRTPIGEDTADISHDTPPIRDEASQNTG